MTASSPPPDEPLSAPPEDPAAMLGRLRVEIDRIDADMHALLMARGEIIERLIAVKARQPGASAFRPGREADMMARIVGRHHGILPLDTVEGIWRIIISTFTYVQAPYALHVDVSAGDPAMRDSARFHFGFTAPFIAHHGPRAVVQAVAASAGDLGLARAVSGIGDGAWWRGLIGARAPKIIARTPFVERADHPASLPLYIISQPLAEAAARGVMLYAVNLPRWSENLPAAVKSRAGALVGAAASDYDLSALAAFPGPDGERDLRQALAEAGFEDAAIDFVGGHAAPFAVAARAD